ncbi:macro domain-containing protein [Sphaerisporangium album]|uniref:macro domain-containing protein n=1 Tax=Sphaerisporangium album TaxID=509200 RepID=UPI0011C05BDC|nr:macro domain-containing protein [Sphaerisporangium album]
MSKRAWGAISLNATAAFGIASAIVQLTSALWAPKDGFPYPGWMATAIGFMSLCYGVIRARPRKHIVQSFSHPDVTIEIRIGDIFEQDAHLAIGASDTFDTDTTDDLIISSKSVIGQCLKRVFSGDRRRMDAEIRAALRSVSPVAAEPTGAKLGKLKRYSIGTVAVLGGPERRIFAVAYSIMGNDLISRSTVNYLWQALDQVWLAMQIHGQRETIAIPLIGTEFARINSVNREIVARMIILSFMARSRDDPVCKRLLVIVDPKDSDRVNMFELEAYLKSLSI